ncbi:hypothetical protein N0V83_010837 [Neocucurbitaria cava]|uniref:Uncharacterized protein n=1 Tax=Neocucurbitaria cava TaxID=798079 RepID=A0A9W8XY03_9PLEO|nr:hypothetical protein N0V83_010837 [Neocucurbitaria cava]
MTLEQATNDSKDHIFFAPTHKPALPLRIPKTRESPKTDWLPDERAMRLILQYVDGGQRFLDAECDYCETLKRKASNSNATCKVGNTKCQSFNVFDKNMRFSTESLDANPDVIKGQMKPFIRQLGLAQAFLDHVFPGEFAPTGFLPWEKIQVAMEDDDDTPFSESTLRKSSSDVE